MFKDWLLSTSSHNVLSYMMLRSMIDKLEAQRVKIKETRLNRKLHEKAAKRQGVSV